MSCISQLPDASINKLYDLYLFVSASRQQQYMIGLSKMCMKWVYEMVLEEMFV